MSDGLGGCAVCLSPDDNTWQRAMATGRLASAAQQLLGLVHAGLSACARGLALWLLILLPAPFRPPRHCTGGEEHGR